MAEAKTKTEYEDVTMTDGRVVKFAGKQKLKKEYIIDPTKYTLDGDTLMVESGAVSLRFDFRNGETRTKAIRNNQLGDRGPALLVFAGHGGEQKGGDNLASKADDPMSIEDMVIATDDLFTEIEGGSWGKGRAEGGGGVSGASIVIKALMEKFGKPVEAIKGFIEKRLADSKARDGENALTRAALYAGYRVSPELAPIIKRLEEEKAAKEASKQKIDVSGDFAALSEQPA